MGVNFSKLLRRVYYSIVPDVVYHDGLPLPEKRLRTGGIEFQNDAFFVQSSRQEAQRLIDHFSFDSGQSVLDVGCGFGRLAIGLLTILPNATYVGLDVNPTAVNWCKKHIEKKHPALNFMLLDVKNERYNPNGKALNDDFQFPLSKQRFDAAYLYSVFSHMEQSDIEVYLHELHRVLTPNGRLFFTAFAEKNVPDMTINPSNYRNIEWKNALHCVRYNLGFLETLLQKSGFQIDEFVYENETNGQSAFYLSKLE